ncbi:MAG: isochorismatase family protein [Actinobacteria bacterium]|nr:isochorismatase family protein [Actinomycetota bacterium]
MKLSGPLLLIDYQEKLIKNVHDPAKVVKNASFLVDCFKILERKILYTEQNPAGLGRTVTELDKHLNGYAVRFEKNCFSSLCDAVSVDLEVTLAETLKGEKQVIVAGVETHICVFQTVYDLLKSGYEVFLAVDACGALRKEHHEVAIQTLSNLGAIALPSISIVYACLESAKNPSFKKVLEVVKNYLKT